MESKNTRQVRLHAKYRQGNYRYCSHGKDVPWLNLSGIWLAKAGFGIGQKIEIRIEEKQLTIKAVD